MFENAFKAVDDILRKDAGCSTALDYVEQSSWILFLKYLDDFEVDRADSAALTGKPYSPIITEEFRWSTWAAPKTHDGKIDYNTALTGDDLRDFVNEKLWKYLASFKQTATDPATLEYKIGEIYSEIRNKLQSGYNIREIINRFDELRFGSAAEQHEMSALYEEKIKGMGNAGRNGGEYYTPRPLIKAIVQAVNPRVGETVYDPAVGSAGFLVEAFEHMRQEPNLSTEQLELLQKNTFMGKEVKSLAYIVGTMNMILHGIEAPRIIHTNTLTENILDIQEKDRFDVILANPPFGGSERPEVQQNFPIRSGETAYLFVQHFIRSLKAGGRAGIVIKNTFLSNPDAFQIRKELLATCNLHTVLDLPKGAFVGTGVRTVVLFFTKGSETKETLFYELNLDRNLGKTNPLNSGDLKDFLEVFSSRKNSENSWLIKKSDLATDSLDLSVQNPNKAQVQIKGNPSEQIIEIETLLNDEIKNLDAARKLLVSGSFTSEEPRVFALESVANVNFGTRVTRKLHSGSLYPVYGGGGETFRVDQTNRSNCYIISRFAMSQECVRFVEGEFFLNDSGLTVETKDESILSQKYLDKFLLANSELIYSLGRGTAQINLDSNAFKQIQIPIPSLSRQEEISSKVQRLEELLSDMKANTQNLIIRQGELYSTLLAGSFV